MKRFALLKLALTAIALASLSQSLLAQGGTGELPSVPKTSLKPKATKPKTTRSAPKSVAAKEPARIDRIAFNEGVEGKIEAASAGRIPPNIYYQEYSLNATEDDIFLIQLSSTQQSLKVELLDEKRIEVALVRDEASGEYRLGTPGAVLPEDGEFRIRVSGPFATPPPAPVPYTLKLVHTGLTPAGYQERLHKIIEAFNQPGERKPDLTIAQLEQLAQDDPKRPGAYEYLGLVFNQYKQDIAKASAAMLQAIQLGGTATFKVVHDSKWRRPNKDRKSPGWIWPDQRTNWLKISKSQLVVAGFGSADKAVLTLKPGTLTEVGRPPAGPFIFLRHTDKTVKPDNIILGFASPAEAEVARDLIKGNLLKKD